MSGEERKLMDLPLSDRQRAGREFRRAIQARAKQWEHERNIEVIMGRSLDLDISDWTAGLTDDEISNIGWRDLARQLREIED